MDKNWYIVVKFQIIYQFERLSSIMLAICLHYNKNILFKKNRLYINQENI